MIADFPWSAAIVGVILGLVISIPWRVVYRIGAEYRLYRKGGHSRAYCMRRAWGIVIQGESF